MALPLLYLTDGTTRVDFFGRLGLHLAEWRPQYAPLKGGGVWMDSALADGRRLVLYRFDNTIDTFTLNADHLSEDHLIALLQNLERLLLRALDYWQSAWAAQPVYLAARGPNETHTRYAVVRGYSLGELGNPYAPPWLPNAAERVALEGLTVAIEHGPWLGVAPGGVQAVSLITGGLVPRVNAMHMGQLAVGDGADDVTVRDNYYVDVGNNYLVLTKGLFVPEIAESAVRLAPFPCPPGGLIINAYLALHGLETAGSTYEDAMLRIYGSKGDGGDFSTDSAGTFALRQRTAHYVPWRYTPKVPWDDVGGSPSLRALLQEIVDTPGWEAGDALTLFLAPPTHATVGGRVAAFEHATAAAPEIVYAYIDDPETERYYLGHEEDATAYQHFVGNHAVRGHSPTHIYRWDAGTGAFTPHNYAPDSNFPLFLGPAEVGDAIYFGVQRAWWGNKAPAQFVFHIDTPFDADSDIYFQWEYTNGVTWAALPANDHTSDRDSPRFAMNASFRRAGVGCISMTPDIAWLPTSILGVAAVWLRARVVAVNTPSVAIPAQSTRRVYSPDWAHITIPAASVPGDLPAAAKITLRQEGDTKTAPTRYLLATRSTARGKDFTPFLNFYRDANIDGVYVQYGPDARKLESVGQPAGGYMLVDLSTATSQRGEWLILSQRVSAQYTGRFRVFLRHSGRGPVRQTGAVQLNVYLHEAVSWTSQLLYASPLEPVPSEGSPLFPLITDFGTLTIPSLEQTGYDTIAFELTVTRNTAEPDIVGLYDLILMPVDEWAGDFTLNARESLAGVSGIPVGLNARRTQEMSAVFDGTDPKEEMRAIARDAAGNLVGNFTAVAATPPRLQANAEQRLFVLQMQQATVEGYHVSPLYGLCSINVEIVPRYRTMRGAR